MQTTFDASRLADALSALLWSNRPYLLGGKLGINVPPDQARSGSGGIDCSGFTRYVLHHASNGQLSLSGGSASQSAALEQMGYPSVPEADFAATQRLCDNTLRIGFRNTEWARNPDGTLQRNGRRLVAEAIGHVWLVLNATTYESSTRLGRNGPMASGATNLRTDTDAIFTLGPVPNWQQRSYDILFAHDAAMTDVG
ncbi:C40 family peptidase [Vannielia litorea]|uniref:Peptidoglycan endopeptidase n=1 Tax=Vannielia litorea TaxID=1217970 RepID=A0A1N6G2F4_9RHOB|nr:C40 family peptidase [Vannielia litorea]SIO01714.1 hypothetical protein SAMN05444002_2149 [Vannielia litorea]